MGEYATPDLSILQGEPAAVAAAASAPASETPADRALAAHHDRLMGLDGVVMLGRGQDPIGNDAIVIGVKRHDQLAGLPRLIDGLPVVTEVIGEVDALPAGSAAPPSSNPESPGD